MKRIRTWLAGLVVWMFLFYNIERISEPINLASFVYVFIAACAVLILLVKPLLPIRLYWYFVGALPIYLVLKNLEGYPILGKGLPITVTEISAIALTIFLAGQIVNFLKEVDEALYQLTIDPERKGGYPFEIGQSQIYREVRRARKREQPLSLLSISVSEHSMAFNLNRFIKEFEQEIIFRYVNARVGSMLVEKLHATDIVTQRNNHFVILLPETAKTEAINVINRIQTVAKRDLGLVLKVGMASFPQEATTFERLLKTAEDQMIENEPEEALVPMPQQEETAIRETVNY